MPTLYVDVDDTLVTWLGTHGGPTPYGAGAEDWRANVDVIRFVEHWARARPQGSVVVWSEGGKDYADTWGRRLLPHIPHVAMGKYNAVCSPGDTFIDDMPFESFKAYTIHPSALTVVMDAGFIAGVRQGLAEELPVSPARRWKRSRQG